MDTEIENQPVRPLTILSFTINGRTVQVTTDPSARLADIIREALDLTGTKISCGIGRCGACSVWLNGKLVNSCLIMAYQAEGSTITTIEGIGEEDNLDPVQQAFLEEGGFQCGYCTPGMIMAVKSLLKDTPHPSDEEIAEGLSGNLCRCTGYSGIVRAVRRAAEKEQ
ncbi:(2Fe-2S)-binding protein [Salibacterium aidingense]|uniref:(2Fe-2S)-binding protein n=1 Tax=Salibacterium aidingense TaxID=384933 RepID=UPI00040042B8|nr:(2Fe-2S)-binding protein [Salibacterium aidingense]